MLDRLIILLFTTLISFSCFSVEKVTLAVENSWPPYSDRLGNGLSKNIITKAFNSVNVEVEFIVVPYARALHMVKNGSADGAFNVTKQLNTQELFNFGEEPILQAQASFYYHNHSNIDLTSATDIPSGTSIALILGYEYGDAFEQEKHRFNEVRVSSQQQIIELILKNRVDMAIMFDAVASFTQVQMGLGPSGIKKGKVNHQSDIYVAFNKKEKTKDIIKLLDTGLRNIKNKQ